MESKLENAVQLLQSEGFAGAYSFVFLIRWASLAGDKALLQRIGKSLEEMDSFRESASLAYVYAEYYEASRAPFCEPAAAFLIGRCSEEDPLYLAALAKCARVFRREEFFALARPLADECPPADPFAALGLLELYRATFHGEYLNRAVAVAEEIRLRFKEPSLRTRLMTGKNRPSTAPLPCSMMSSPASRRRSSGSGHGKCRTGSSLSWLTGILPVSPSGSVPCCRTLLKRRRSSALSRRGKSRRSWTRCSLFTHP